MQPMSLGIWSCTSMATQKKRGPPNGRQTALRLHSQCRINDVKARFPKSNH